MRCIYYNDSRLQKKRVTIDTNNKCDKQKEWKMMIYKKKIVNLA